MSQSNPSALLLSVLVLATSACEVGDIDGGPDAQPSDFDDDSSGVDDEARALGISAWRSVPSAEGEAIEAVATDGHVIATIRVRGGELVVERPSQAAVVVHDGAPPDDPILLAYIHGRGTEVSEDGSPFEEAVPDDPGPSEPEPDVPVEETTDSSASLTAPIFALTQGQQALVRQRRALIKCMAQASGHAYDAVASVPRVCGWQFEPAYSDADVKTWSNNSRRTITLGGHKVQVPGVRRWVFAFRGTDLAKLSTAFRDLWRDGSSQVTVQNKDIIVTGLPYDVPMAVGRGFFERWKASQRTIHGAIVNSLNAGMGQAPLGYQRTEFFVTGHSLGGAVATLASYNLASVGRQAVEKATRKSKHPLHVSAFVFNPPRTGGSDWTTMYQAAMIDRRARLTFRQFTRNYDPVSVLPAGQQHPVWLTNYDDKGPFAYCPQYNARQRTGTGPALFLLGGANVFVHPLTWLARGAIGLGALTTLFVINHMGLDKWFKAKQDVDTMPDSHVLCMFERANDRD